MALITFGIRAFAGRDREATMAIARRLEDWFNEEGLRQMELDLAKHEGFVAVDRGAVIGFITFRRIDRETADLSWLGVASELHRRGIGTALLGALVDRLRSEGIRHLRVSTVADSLDYEPYARTRAFYRSRGFKDLRVDPKYFGHGDDRYDRLVLQRDLVDG